MAARRRSAIRRRAARRSRRRLRGAASARVRAPRGSRRSRRSARSRDRRRRPSFSEGRCRKRCRGRRRRSSVRVHSGKSARQREGPHRPGGGRVEPGARVVGRRTSPAGVPNGARIVAAVGRLSRRLADRRRGDRVAEVVAGLSLLVVGAVRASCAELGRRLVLARERAALGWRGPRRRDPARSRRPAHARPGDRLAVAAEARRGAEVEAEQEAGDPPRLPSVAGRGEGDRHGAGVARPDVGPAVARPGGDGAAAPVGQRPQDQQRAPVHRPRPARRSGAQRPRPREPAPVGFSRRGYRRRRTRPAGRIGDALDQPPADRADVSNRVRPSAPSSAARWSRAGSAGAPSRLARAASTARAEPHPGDDPGVRRHGAGRLPVRGVVDQRPARRARARRSTTSP